MRQLLDQPLYQEGPESTVTHDGHEYQLDTILFLSRFIPIEPFPTIDLEWMYDGVDVTKDQVEYTDITCPIIVTEWNHKWVIIDGYHRVAKALLAGQKTIPAKIIHSLILNLSLIK